ncbi:unnamed protein product [Protopolystoma xenopodis]|uniref:Uncharacterized protein n=1 Tax=Protopolystoma xenopodis TaxID=117903 RepID=A0A3S5FDU4_9PLAT|nr:unnamed protein product [Protopolystoma xenopodis]
MVTLPSSVVARRLMLPDDPGLLLPISQACFASGAAAISAGTRSTHLQAASGFGSLTNDGLTTTPASVAMALSPSPSSSCSSPSSCSSSSSAAAAAAAVIVSSASATTSAATAANNSAEQALLAGTAEEVGQCLGLGLGHPPIGGLSGPLISSAQYQSMLATPENGVHAAGLSPYHLYQPTGQLGGFSESQAAQLVWAEANGLSVRKEHLLLLRLFSC